MASLASGATLAPDMGLKLSRAWCEGYFNLQQQWLEKIAGLASRSGQYSYDEMDLQPFKDWQELYEKEFQRFFKIPPLGLTRLYQERTSLFMDNLNILQNKMSEFLFLLYLPMDKAQRKMQEQMEQDYEAGEVHEDFQEYYQAWLKILEGHYMTLFQSPEYVECLNQSMEALGEFTRARRAVLQDVIKTLPVPTEQDMDELHKELYLLKKQIKQLKKAAETK